MQVDVFQAIPHSRELHGDHICGKQIHKVISGRIDATCLQWLLTLSTWELVGVAGAPAFFGDS